jgi:hypothetical protein
MSDPVAQYRLKEAGRQVRREVAELVYYYSQYTVEDVLEMPDGDRRLLLTYARLHCAELLLGLTQAIAAGQSKAGFKKFTNDLEGVIKTLAKQL